LSTANSNISGRSNLNDNILASEDLIKKRLYLNSPHVVAPKKPLIKTNKFALLQNVDYLRLQHPLFTDHWAVYAIFSCSQGENLELKLDEEPTDKQ
jgi:hypothetical protein